MDWGLMLLLVLMDENSTLLVVCMCWTAGYPWISMDIAQKKQHIICHIIWSTPIVWQTIVGY